MRPPTQSEGATVSTMHIFEAVGGIYIEVDGNTAVLFAGISEYELEPEELRLVAKAFTQAAQHLEAARR